MKWNTTVQKLGIWMRPTEIRPEDRLTSAIEMPSQSADSPGATPTVRKLRRRLLSRKGARMLVSMVDTQDKGTLSILDVNGVVVYWHDGARATLHGAAHVLDHHVAQFYAPEKDSRVLANDHLSKAFARGGSSELGWRRHADGSVFWGLTVIEPLLLADGRLQGFTHLTRAVSEPQEPIVAVIQRQLKGRWRNTRSLRCVGTMAHAMSPPIRKVSRAANPGHFAQCACAFG
jgi:hypothetical protein